MKRLTRIALAVVATACGSSSSPPNGDCVSFTQWGRDPTHQGNVCVTGQATTRVLAKIFYDPFIVMEKDDQDGDILVHYQSPLIVDDDVYMMVKSGTYTPCDPTLGCVFSAISCTDGNSCTADTCDAAIGCLFTPISGCTSCLPVGASCETSSQCCSSSCGGKRGNKTCR